MVAQTIQPHNLPQYPRHARERGLPGILRTTPHRPIAGGRPQVAARMGLVEYQDVPPCG